MLPTRWRSHPQPPDHQSDTHRTEPPRPAQPKYSEGFMNPYLYAHKLKVQIILFSYQPIKFQGNTQTVAKLSCVQGQIAEIYKGPEHKKNISEVFEK